MTRPTRPRAARPLLAAGLLAAGLLAAGPAVAADVGYVAALVGDAEIEAAQSRGELSFLDLLPEGARLRLEAGSELKVCHSLAGIVSSAIGPAVLRVTGRELVGESGAAPVKTGERCNAPLVSKTQGGSAFRSLQVQPVPVGTRSWLRVVPATKGQVRRATLLSPDEKTRLSEFQTVSVSPVVLAPGSVYPLVVEFADGRRLTVRLAAREGVAAEVAVINVAP